MKKIMVISGTRAEYGLLKPIIQKINMNPDWKLCLVVTGTHLEKNFGFTYTEIEQDGLKINHKLPMHLDSDNPKGILTSMSIELKQLADLFEIEKPNLLVILGDRYEIEIAAIAALINRVPIAHIHGGELTEGVIDDSIRHSISKMSSIHFVSTEEYKNRLIQLGEQPASVHYVGSLGVENSKKLNLLTKEELSAKFAISWNKPLILVTYHPVTLENDTATNQFQTLLSVISEKVEYNYLFTYSNGDAGGSSINTMIDDYVKLHKNCKAYPSLGQINYLSTVRYCAAVMGNSSSGIIEVPSFHIPTINIGDRQRGRVQSKTIVNCGYSSDEIKMALETALSPSFLKQCKEEANPYEKENTSDIIINKMEKFLDNFKTTKKTFFDITFKL